MVLGEKHGTNYLPYTNELSWDDVYKIFWINLFVFFDLAATNGCFSEKVL